MRLEDYKILIIEDEKQIARFLELELKHEGYNVDISYNGKEGLKKIESADYDLVLLDIMLPDLNGIEICKRVRRFSAVPIIMLTAKDATSDKVMGLDIGADDYMTKPFAIEELLARIRVIRRNDTSNKNDKKMRICDLSMDRATHQVVRAGKVIELTKREYDLLECLLDNKGIVLTRDQLLEKVWGFDYTGDANVVDVYIRYLRSKIDDEYEVKLINTVRGVGYVIKETKNEDQSV